MASYWLVVGTPEHWQVAFENGNIWGLQQVKIRWWDRLTEGDGLIFYVTRPVGGAIGIGKVITKFKQDKPLWPREVEAQRVLWPSDLNLMLISVSGPRTGGPADWRSMLFAQSSRPDSNH